jgi:hypothetical protein
MIRKFNEAQVLILALVFATVFGLDVQPASAQTTTYSYTGNAYNQFGGTFTCPPVCGIRGSFTVAAPLPPTSNFSFTPISFSFTDGLTTFTPANTTNPAFDVVTDSSGNIVSWNMQWLSPNDAMFSGTNPPGCVGCRVVDGSFNPNAFAERDNAPGIWTSTLARGLYDDFSDGFINPSKWTVLPMCGGNYYDCAREVRSGHLRLVIRGYGDPNRDSGTSFAASQVMFRTPNAIDSVQLHLNVRSFSSSACPTNSDAAHPQFLISGTFFNTGTGDASGDMSGFLMVERRTDDTFDAPGLLRVGGFMSLNGQFFNNVDLGTLQIGEGAQATLRWDRTNKALVVRIVKSVTTPSIVEQSMPYALPDSQLPFVAAKSIQLGSFAPNCTSQQSLAAMDANVDNVRVNVGP